MTTHYEKIQALGNRMASNLETMGVSASFGDGGLTLADKILQIQHFTDGLLLWANKDIIQTGDTVNFCALLLEDKKAVSGETVFFYDLNNPPITRSSAQTHTLNVELGSSFKLIYQSSSTYGESINLSNEDDSLLIEYSGYNNNIYISINGGVPVTAFSCEGFLKLENGVLSDDGGHTYNLSSYNLNFKLKEMQTVGNNCSVYINPIGSAVTDANGIASVTYTGVGAGKLNVQAKTIDGRLQSEIYEVIDAIVIDRATSSDYNDLFRNMDGITRNINDSAYYIDRSGTSASNTSTTSYSLNDGVCVEITITEITNIYQLRVSLQGDDRSVVRSISDSNITTGTIRFECKPNNTKIYMNDTLILNENENNISSVMFQIRTASNSINNFNYKNLLIYPI